MSKKSLKTIGFRPSNIEEGIILEYMRMHNLKKKSEAIKAIINDWEKLKRRGESKPSSQGKPAAKEQGRFEYLPSIETHELPYELQEEVNRFLRGQGIDRNGNVTCPTIKTLFDMKAWDRISFLVHPLRSTHDQ